MTNYQILSNIERLLIIKLSPLYELATRQYAGWNGYVVDNDNYIIGLYLSYCSVQNINILVSYLKELPRLKELDLRGNSISDISSLNYLGELTYLNLAQNNISNISSLNYLGELTYLNLAQNNIIDISSLNYLKELTHLDLSQNSITDISTLSTCKSIKNLILERNNIKNIDSLNELKTLKSLSLDNNLIGDISTIKDLKSLKSLNISFNPLYHLPDWIIDFDMEIKWNSSSKGEEGCIMVNNPFESPPISIIQQGKKALTDYFTQIKKEEGKTQFLFEAKLLVIGEGGTGKTSFIRKLQDAYSELPKEKDTTFGIEVGKWSYPLNSVRLSKFTSSSFYVNLWDFGGQKIYQGTHQIFFADKCFYVLIADTREQKTDFSYWLNTVEQLAGNDSLLIIILNKKFGQVQKFDESGYRGHFGKLIKEVIEIDLKNDISKLFDLQNRVKMYLKELPGIGDPLPPSWIDIREDLLAINNNFISLDRFREICKRHNIVEASMIETLSGYFNRIGAFTHFINDSLLQERIYLNSNWLVKTVYEVLDNEIVKSKKGRLTEEDIKAIWVKNELHYEINKLAQLMHIFGLMYRIYASKDYVVPAHLPIITPYEEWPYANSSDILQFIYEFDKYMPQGIMSRLIVALHHHIKDHNLVWYGGVNIEANGTRAEIIESYGGSNRFEIKIVGKNKIEMLAIIRERFSDVLKPFNKLQYKQLVPCICPECKKSSHPAFHDYNLLLKFRQKGMGSQCHVTGETINTEELLKITEPVTKVRAKEANSAISPIKIFLASSSELKVEREQFEININRRNKAWFNTGLFIELVIWEDFLDIISQTRLQDQYNKALKESDIFVMLYFSKVGKFTEEEFETAFGQFKQTNNPLILTYFKDAGVNTGSLKKDDILSVFSFQEKLQALGHFPTLYKNADDLIRQFNEQLEKIFQAKL